LLNRADAIGNADVIHRIYLVEHHCDRTQRHRNSKEGTHHDEWTSGALIYSQQLK